MNTSEYFLADLREIPQNIGHITMSFSPSNSIILFNTVQCIDIRTILRKFEKLIDTELGSVTIHIKCHLAEFQGQ